MSNTKHEQLAIVADLVAEEILSLTDDEVRAWSENIEGDAEKIKSIYSRAVDAVGKRRMVAARRQALNGALTVVGTVPLRLQSREEARKHVSELVASSPLMQEKLTLAARSGTALSDSDMQSLLEDLAALGAFQDLDAKK
jgi:hypothetical protein